MFLSSCSFLCPFLRVLSRCPLVMCLSCALFLSLSLSTLFLSLSLSLSLVLYHSRLLPRDFLSIAVTSNSLIQMSRYRILAPSLCILRSSFLFLPSISYHYPTVLFFCICLCLSLPLSLPLPLALPAVSYAKLLSMIMMSCVCCWRYNLMGIVRQTT